VNRASSSDAAEGAQTPGELLSIRRRRSGPADSEGEGKLKDGRAYDENRALGSEDRKTSRPATTA
jgi:hypothetical protein